MLLLSFYTMEKYVEPYKTHSPIYSYSMATHFSHESNLNILIQPAQKSI